MKNLFARTLANNMVLLAIALTLLTASSVQVFYTNGVRALLEKRLAEKINFTRDFYAIRIADSLNQQDDIILQQDIAALEKDPEITNVIVVDGKGEIRYHADAAKVGAKTDDERLLKSLETQEAFVQNTANAGGRALSLVTPLKVQMLPRPIGAARFDLTYHYIDKQISDLQKRYVWFLFGVLLAAGGLMRLFTGKWILLPLRILREVLKRFDVRTPDPVLPQPADEFAQVYDALRELGARIQLDLQDTQFSSAHAEARERAMALKLGQTLAPGARVVIADKENRVLGDTEAAEPLAEPPHLLDLISEPGFATLVDAAFQKEGDITRGTLTLNGRNVEVGILRLAPTQSISVKTLIVLK